jgi:outer membrane protein assembly factor BamB
MMLNRDPITGKWKYGTELVSQKHKADIETDLQGARGELSRYQRYIEDLEEALFQIDQEDIIDE